MILFISHKEVKMCGNLTYIMFIFMCLIVSFSFVNHAMKWYMFSWTEAYFGLPYLFTFCMIFFFFFCGKIYKQT